MDSIIDGTEWTGAYWDHKNHGNHRAKILVEDASEYSKLIMKWRRGDKHPENHYLIIEFEDGRQTKDYCPIDINNEFAHIVFKPEYGCGIYYIYYLAFEDYGDYDDSVKMKYNNFLFDPSATSKEAYKHKTLPKAKCLAFEYRETPSDLGFNSFFPMEVIATFEETYSIKKKNKKEPFLLYYEDGYHPIKMVDNIPYRWVDKTPNSSIIIKARPGEYKVFQLGLFATKGDLNNIKVACNLDQSFNMTCFNTEGIDYKGEYFTKEISLSKDKVQALWFGIDIPKDIKGEFKGNIEVSCGDDVVNLNLSLNVEGEPAKDRFEDMRSHSRIAWINDTTGNEDVVIPPYKEVETKENVISILDREIKLNDLALPMSIKSRDIEILAKEVSFPLGENLKVSSFENVKQGKSFVTYVSNFESDFFVGSTTTVAEFDGCVDVSVKLKAKKNISFDNRLKVPLRKEISTYLMGYGKQGGYRTRDIEWKWKECQKNNMVWIGDVDCGLYLELRDTKDTFDMYYNITWGNPPSWYNENLGGSRVFEEGDRVVINAYTGERDFAKGEQIEFNFRFLITPFHKIDPNHWDLTYVYHGKNKDANYAHEHHMSYEYPFINYPLFHKDILKEKFEKYLKDFKGINIYHTVREITTHLPEIYMFASLGEEIFEHEHSLKGSQKEMFLIHYGGKSPWVREHLHFDCHPEFIGKIHSWGGVDPAIHTNGLSRIANFYIKSIEYGMKVLPYDGVYIDSINTDRRTMKRLCRVLYKEKGYHRINFHGYNMYNLFNTQVSPALTYMEHMPYFSSLWFGEEFEYDLGPDYWLVECSGIPFGLTSEELYFSNILNEYRGMLFGMGSRIYENASYLWRFWKEYKIEESTMIGWWDKDCPVKTNNEKVLATCYKKKNEALIAVATWSDKDEKIKIEIDFDKLGIDKDNSKITLPQIEGFQEAKEYPTDHEFVIKPRGGFMGIVK
ncbi:MAG: hypothetical protein IJS60_05870 [Abditibacteriota bacterium]|nr:hypothetical protein [Abditibacteriota bacterium]